MSTEPINPTIFSAIRDLAVEILRDKGKPHREHNVRGDSRVTEPMPVNCRQWEKLTERHENRR